MTGALTRVRTWWEAAPAFVRLVVSVGVFAPVIAALPVATDGRWRPPDVVPYLVTVVVVGVAQLRPWVYWRLSAAERAQVRRIGESAVPSGNRRLDIVALRRLELMGRSAGRWFVPFFVLAMAVVVAVPIVAAVRDGLPWLLTLPFAGAFGVVGLLDHLDRRGARERWTQLFATYRSVGGAIVPPWTNDSA